MSAAPLSTEAVRRTHQRLSRPILLNLTHTTLLSLCLNPDRMAWPVRVANLSWPPNGSKRSLGPPRFSDLLGLTRPCEDASDMDEVLCMARDGKMDVQLDRVAGSGVADGLVAALSGMGPG